MRPSTVLTLVAVSAVFLSGADRTAAARAGSAGHPSANVTFNGQVAPILYRNCASCHRPGEVAPFSLLTFRDAARRASLIAGVTRSHAMPPWKAAEGRETFINARTLTPAEIATLQKWASEGAPEGDASRRPVPPKFTNGWALGPPDAVFDTGASYPLTAEGPDVYRCFVLPTDFAQDRYVSTIEVRPGNRSVVHHVIVYLDTSGAARKLDAADPGPGYTSFGGVGFVPAGSLGGWAPGLSPRRLPPGVGHRLPKGADIVVQVHYHRSGKPETDRTRIGLYFTKGPIDKRVRDFMVINPGLHIPPGDPNAVVHAESTIPADVTLLDITPHMHLLGRRMTVVATLPNGSRKTLVNVPDWDFNWQTTYSYRNPIHLPRGTKVSLTAVYDNSTRNPRNPNRPPKLVTWGEQTTDEMCIAFLGFTADRQHLAGGTASDSTADSVSGDPQARMQQRILKMFDKDGDGKLSAEERAAMLKFLGEQQMKRQETKNQGGKPPAAP